MDPRTKRMAKVLVDYSADLKPGDRVLIEATPVAEPLVRAVFSKALEVGAHPFPLISLSGFVSYTGLDDIFLREANDDQLAAAMPFYEFAYAHFDSRIRIHSDSNTKALSRVAPQRITQRRKATQSILESQFQRGATRAFKWVTTQFPTQSYAQDAEMSLEEYKDFLYTACHVNDPEQDPVAYWLDVKKEQDRIIETLIGKDRVEVRGPNVDLTLSIRERIFKNACGENNMPDGEIFTGPVEESVEGWIRFTYPAIFRGAEVDGVELHFERGKVVRATAKKNEALLHDTLETDPGARFLGEFAIGTNFGIQQHTRNILFDEKIGGTIHLALGAGYPETGSKNESAIHWDMICDMSEQAAIIVDGETLYENGAFKV